MKRLPATTTAPPAAARLSPLSFDCCRCGIGRTMACLSCKRFARFGLTVAQRRAAWGRT